MHRLPLTTTLLLSLIPPSLHAQTPGAAPAATLTARQLGTVKAIAGPNLTLLTASGSLVTVTIAPGAPVLQLPPGSTDLKSAQTATLPDIAIGDRVATGKPGDTLTASRVILMKSTAIATRNATEQADWQRRGSGGIVRSIDGPTLTVAAGANGVRTLQVTTSASTRFRRYADDSIKFEDAQPGTLADIRPGDQLRVRGLRLEAASGPNTPTTITAEDIVSGTFSNLSGPVTAIDASASTLTLTDTNTKQPATIRITPKSDLRKLSPEAAASLTSPARSATAPPTPAPASRPSQDPSQALSALLPQLPTLTLADLHPGDSVLIVASQDRAASASTTLTVITLVSGVGPLLASPSAGSRPISLSPWNLGSPDSGPSQ